MKYGDSDFREEHEVPRTQMPQVDEKDIGKLLVFVSKAGHKLLWAGETFPNDFIGHQFIDLNKVAHMAEKPDLLSKPVICTRQFEIIDGNHRLAAHRLNETMVPYVMLDCTFVEALNLLNVFPFAYELTPLTPERN